MDDQLLLYYHKELAFLRQQGAAFAEKYPKIAGQLQIKQGVVEDPHVSRLLEGVALMSAQVHQKLDDHYPELTEALVEQLYPDYQAPIPSMSVLQFTTQNITDHQLHLPVGYTLETQHQEAAPCQFQVAYDTELSPLSVTEASFDNAPFQALQLRELRGQPFAQSVLRLKISGEYSTPFSKYGISQLRLYLQGQGQGQAQVTQALYQLLIQSCLGIVMIDPATQTILKQLPARHLQAVGFDERQQVVPYTQRSFAGYRLLVEYFLFPEKFMFVELQQLQANWFGQAKEIELYFYFDQAHPLLAKQVTADNVLLNCAPVVNLFEANLEKVRLSQTQGEHLLTGAMDQAERLEVIRVTDLQAFDMQHNELNMSPFYASALSHLPDPQASQLFWKTRRQLNDEPRCESYLTVIDGQHQSIERQWVDDILINPKALCCNRNLPASLPSKGLHFRVHRFRDSIKQVRCLQPFSEIVRPRLFEDSRWQLVSHLTLTHFDHPQATQRLKQLLQLYQLNQASPRQALIDAIQTMTVTPTTARVVQQGRVGFCHGSAIEIIIAADELSGMNLFLFGQVLSQFFAYFAAINSFTQLSFRLAGQQTLFHQWAAQAGEQRLL